MEVITQVAKNLYSGTSKGRKVKPPNHTPLVKKIEQQINSRSPIILLGVFSLIPKDIALIINNKELYATITLEQRTKIVEVILSNINNPNCVIVLKEEGVEILKNPGLYENIDFRKIFNTQERQLILG